MTFHHGMGLTVTQNAPVIFDVTTYPEEVRARARAAYDRGQVAFRAQQWNTALPAYTEAYLAIPHHSALQAIGLSLLRVGRHSEGIGRLQRVLAAFDADPAQSLPAARRAELEAEIERARARMRAARQSAPPSVLPTPTPVQLAKEAAALRERPAEPLPDYEGGMSMGAKVAIGVGIAAGVAGLIGVAMWAARR